VFDALSKESLDLFSFSYVHNICIDIYGKCKSIYRSRNLSLEPITY
jgi:hypothetical protein